jgi:hypothetical protein
MRPLTRDEIRKAVNDASFIAPTLRWGQIEQDEQGNIWGMICPAGHLCLQRGMSFMMDGEGGLYPTLEYVADAAEVLEALVAYCIAVGVMAPGLTQVESIDRFLVRQTAIVDELQRRLNAD